ncbi:MAG: insulinase family protein [Bdellovibrionales bacterium]|nr:insulinase family protein [Bdellovibrionales bacterium]
MKTLHLHVLSVCCVVLLAACTAHQPIPNRPESIETGEVNFEIPEPERWELPNGLTVLYYYNDELPQMRGTMYFPGGSLTDYSGVPGLLEATGNQMREGSIEGVSPQALDKRLDDLAASIESGFGDEYGSVGFYSLEEDFPEVFKLFTAVIRKPAFDASRLKLWQQLANEAIRRRRDAPDTMANMAFADLVYGPDSQFAKVASPESVAKVTRREMQKMHRLFVRPDGAYLAISGSIPRKQVEPMIQQAFGDWPRGVEQRPPLPELRHSVEPGIYLLQRDFDQATIIIGHRGPPRHIPDVYPLKIFNQLFGHSGFGSVLFNRIRSQLGLAYSVYGGVFPGTVEGLFQIAMGTRVNQAPTAIRTALEITKEAEQASPPEDDFVDAKAAVTRSFVFRFADPAFVVNRVAILELLGFPPGYDQQYLDRIAEVSPEAVREAAAKWIAPEDVVIVVVGNVTPEELRSVFGEQFPIRTFTFDTEPRFSGSSGR